MAKDSLPPLRRVALSLRGPLAERFEAFVRTKGWTPQEGAKILLAYAADLAVPRRRAPEEVRDEWSAARSELAVLRHRAYLAEDAIRTLRLNITGLEKSNLQFRASLAHQRARRERLRRSLPGPSPEHRL